MRQPWSWLAALAIACAPQAPSPHAPRAATVVHVPPPAPDASAPTATEGTDDASLPSETYDAGPGTGPGTAPDETLDGGVGFSFSGSLRFATGDGGIVFDGSLSSDGGLSLGGLSPDLVVRSALLIPTPSGKQLLLFDRVTDCGNRTGRHTETTIDWKRGTKTTFTNLSLINGHSEHYKGHVEVLSAPTAPGSTGAIQLDPPPDGNVRGGRVPVRVCP